MNGQGPICLRVAQHSFFEHTDLRCAKAEAERLALRFGDAIVVYVPVLRLAPPPRVVEDRLSLPHDTREVLGDYDDLPF